jgi:soluble cytochrome b562
MTNQQDDTQTEMAKDIREIKQAVLGDKSIGLNGLVDDMREMKSFRQGLEVRVAAVAGGVTVLVMGGKAVLAKLLG